MKYYLLISGIFCSISRRSNKMIKKATQKTPITIKTFLQLILAFIAAIIVFHLIALYFYRIRTVDQFKGLLAKLDPLKHVSLSARLLPTRGTIFCWVMTTVKYHDSRMPAINQTWLKRCDHGQFFTNKPIPDEFVPHTAIFEGFSDSYEDLFWKSFYALYYTYEHISKDFQWYMKADDDTYLIMENLRHYLQRFNSSEPLFLGFRLKPYLENGYNSGGIYVLSNAAMKLFSEQLYLNETLCSFNDYEDVGIAKCFESLGILPLDTKDSHGKQRFLPFSVQQTFDGSLDEEKAEEWLVDVPNQGFEAFSRELISIHHMTPEAIRSAEVFLYHVKLHNV
uniref:N-acetylgalactosaminide beta-1,3-galactosyltransferase n=1 Tax=Acrobeloides nanus TaxID=290746 RepID=A0A914EGI2_9BILA